MANTNYSDSLEQFIRMLFNVYLEDRDFVKFASLLHSDITWIGTGRQEVCHNYSQAIELLEAEKKSWSGRFKITSQEYNIISLSDEFGIVTGNICAIEDGINTILLEMQSRLTAVCKKENGEWKLFHIHFSVPNAAQQEDEYVHKNLVRDYNKKLEETLTQRTILLKQKSTELEALTNNIFGGVLLCLNDKNYTIEYASQGFEELTGYSSADLKPLFNVGYLNFIYENDRDAAQKNLCTQLKASNNFALEYRLVHKTGRIIWVLDKGFLLTDNNGQQRFQSILTDISLQKQQQEDLRLSEKRYETAMQLSDIVMFEYDILNRQLFLYERDAELYSMPNIIDNGVETLIRRGIIQPESVNDFRKMYQKIHDGEPMAKANVIAKDAFGILHDYEMTLRSVFDSDGKPLRAIGVRKNISQMLKLQKEEEFAKTLVSNKIFIFEADITNNKVISFDQEALDALEADLSLPYSVLIRATAAMYIEKETRDLFLKSTSIDFIRHKFERGEQLIVFSYKLKSAHNEYLWYEATINIIKDDLTGAIFVRLYHANINNRKIIEEKAQEEQHLYESMVSRSKLAYEINATQDLAVNGHEHWLDTYGIATSNNYTQMITSFSTLAIYCEDSETFMKTLARENILTAFAQGERQISCQYRKPNENGELRWANCTMHMYQDPATSDVKAFAFVEDIDDQKRESIALKFSAEHDILTGLLNKSTTEIRIDSFLKSPDSQNQTLAFFMIDIDYFKSVNDVFGHLYGDDVLREIGTLLKALFSDDDVVGRVGGDEFVVLMKKSDCIENINAKAQSICSKLSIKYSDGQRSSVISASVGIALYPKHGKTFNDLFRKADELLYQAKNAGRNRYSYN